MIYLQNRAEPSAPMRVLAPLIAIIATLIAGGLLFAVLNKNPFVAIRMIIWDPVFGEFAFYYRGQVSHQSRTPDYHSPRAGVWVSCGVLEHRGRRDSLSWVRWAVARLGWRFILLTLLLWTPRLSCL